jgi:hypothetical protein
MPRELGPRASRLQQRCRGRERYLRGSRPSRRRTRKLRCGGRDARGLSSLSRRKVKRSLVLREVLVSARLEVLLDLDRQANKPYRTSNWSQHKLEREDDLFLHSVRRWHKRTHWDEEVWKLSTASP